MGQSKQHSSNLTPEEIAEQASKPDLDQIFKQPRRGDESKGDPDDRDVAGAVDHEDTPHGREERKHEIEKNLRDVSDSGGLQVPHPIAEPRRS